MPWIATLSVYLLVLKRVWRDIRDSRNGGHCQTVCWQSEADCAESKSDQICEIRLTKLPYVAQQVGIVHFYAVAEIKGLSCRLRWMGEWRNLLTLTHVSHRLCHVGSREWRVTKIWVQGATANNWFPRDNGIWLYLSFYHISQFCYDELKCMTKVFDSHLCIEHW